MEDDHESQSRQDNTSTNLVRLDEIAERKSRRQIRQMADIYRFTDEDLDEKKIIHPKMRDKRVLNVFRELRTKLIQLAGEKNFILMVTSLCENGGATFVSNNVAASIALDHGKTAVIVDCNLYSPVPNTLVEDADIGFSDFLEDPSLSMEEIIYATGVSRLRLIPAGNAKEIGPEYYTSYRMKQFVEELRGRYSDRYVVLDAPPIGSTADARILTDMCDYVVVVVPYGMATRDQVEQAIESIPENKFAGLIFNH